MSEARTNSSTPPRLQARAMRGAAWQVIGHGGEQAMRFAANIALAALLAPGDFGLMGLAASWLALAEAITFLGTDHAILRYRSGRCLRFVSCVHAINLVRGAMLTALLLLLTPFLARGFGQADQWPVFAIVALQPFLLSTAHPASWLLVKDLKLKALTTARLVATAVGLGGAIVLAIRLQDARALVAGQVGVAALLAAGTWIVAPVRPLPRFDRRAIRLLMKYARGAIGSPILLASIAQAPVYLLAGASTTLIGIFLMNQRIADAARKLAVQGLSPVLVPAYATIARDSKRVRSAWTRVLGLASLTILPTAAAVAVMDWRIPDLLFGLRYRADHGVFALLAISGACSALAGFNGPVFFGLGRPDYDRAVHVVRACVLYAIGVPGAWLFGLPGAAAALAISAFAGFTAGIVLAMRVTGVPVRDVLRSLVPGVLAMGVAAAVMMVTRALLPETHVVGFGLVFVIASVAMGVGWRQTQRDSRRDSAAPASASAGVVTAA